MKTIAKLLVFGWAGLLCLSAPPPAAAGQLDHLICYKVIDKLQVKAAFDLFAELQPEFSAKGCTIVKVDDFCVPATKLNVQPTSADLRADIAGPALHVDYIGYIVRCAKQVAPPNKVVIDQFGQHRHLRYKIEKIYVPAKKGPPPCGTTDGTSCGGACPGTADQCRIDPVDKACKCLPPDDGICGGKPDKQGMCGGPCPDPAKPQCQLTLSSTGQKVCDCGPPPPPRCGINAATGTCGGDCPNKAEKCLLKSPNECTCMPASTPCSLQPGTVPVCGGDCPIAGDVCALDLRGDCSCGAPPPTPCGQNPLTGACGGECPTGEKCLLDSANNCNCAPPPCGSDATGQCTSGACPNPATQTCKLDASGACNCDPPSCGVNGNTCGGVCPAGRLCVPGTTGGALSCRCE